MRTSILSPLGCPQDIADSVGALAAAGLKPDRLELEVTESVLLSDNEPALTIVHQLREIGVRISLDDFGTGYSSLSYLRSFRFDKIKIDRSFVRDLATRNDSFAIVKAVIGLGKSLGISTTAEGVERRPDSISSGPRAAPRYRVSSSARRCRRTPC